MNIIIAFYILLDIAFIGFFAVLFRQRIREEKEKEKAGAEPEVKVDLECRKTLGCDPAGCAECVRAAAAQR